MRVKLIAIAVLALLLCAMAPTAATAKAPQHKTVVAPVYFGTRDPPSYELKLSPYPVGKLTLNFDTGRWTYTGIWLPEGRYGVIIDMYGGSIILDAFTVTSHAHGAVTASGIMDPPDNGIAKTAYLAGNPFYIGGPFPL